MRAALSIALTLLVLLGCKIHAQQPAEASATESPKVAQAYLYLEPFQARVEVLVDVATALTWTKQPTAKEITPAIQQAVRDRMMTMARGWCHVRADEAETQGQLTGVAFVRGEPGRTLPLEEGATVPAKELMMGLMFEFAIPGSPAQIEVRWPTFVPPLTKLPLTVFFGNSTENLELSQLLPNARWMNNNRLPHPKPLAETPKIPQPTVYAIPLPMIIWASFGLVFFLYMEVRDKKFPGGFAPFFLAWLVGIGVTYNMSIKITDPFAPKVAPVTTQAEGEKILQPLLRNVYRAFDYRTESEIYDRLARSVHGDLLRTLYLQTVKALTLDGSEGARVHVTDLSVDIDQVKANTNGFTAEGEWTALGTVGHWGHQHQRVNRYKAKLTVNPVGNEWKITALEVLEERRL